MDRTTLLWAIALFFGASLLFSALQDATAGAGVAVTVAVQVAALAAVIAGIVLFVRRRR